MIDPQIFNKVSCEPFKPIQAKDYPDAIPATISTCAHEIGHSICALERICKVSYVKVRMTEGYDDADFQRQNEMCVHGFHKLPDGSEALPLDEAILGYGGNVGCLLYLEQFANMTNDELFDVIHSAEVKWSESDLALIAKAGDRGREAFDGAVAIIRKHLDGLREYTKYMAKDFLSDPKEVVCYTVDSLAFKVPAKDSVTF